MPLTGMMASTEAMRAIFDGRGGAQAMLDVEAALASAQAATGMIGRDAAAAIAAACDASGLDLDRLARDGANAGTIVIPLVAWLRAGVGDFAASVHRGGTSQDIIDTALVLQIRRGVELLDDDLRAMGEAAAALMALHAGTPMLARTLMQPALPSRFGLKAANWLAAIDDARAAMGEAAGAALLLQCGGAAGTLDGIDDATRVAFAAALSLPAPALPWHTGRGPLTRLGCTIAAAVGALGKIATDLVLMMQAEIGELTEPAAPGRGGSSAMAHKRNPTLSIAVRAAATRTPHLAATLLTTMAQEHERAAGAWQAECAVWPELMLVASGAFAAMREALAGLIVDTEAMRRNLAHAPAALPSPAIPALIEAARRNHETLSESLGS